MSILRIKLINLETGDAILDLRLFGTTGLDAGGNMLDRSGTAEMNTFNDNMYVSFQSFLYALTNVSSLSRILRMINEAYNGYATQKDVSREQSSGMMAGFAQTLLTTFVE